MKKFLKQNWLTVALALLLLASLVPIVLVGRYAHPFGDDLSFSRFVHLAAEEGSSTLAALGYTVKRFYFGWQGTYAGTVLMALQPGLISEGAYALTPIILLAALALSTLALSHALLCRWLGQSRAVWLGVTAGILLVTVQNQISPNESLFWWNGSIYYTFFYALTLLLATCMIRLRLEPDHPRLLLGAALTLAVVVGGGNYVSGLLACVLLAVFAGMCLLWDRKRIWQPILVESVLVTCFLINALAPGNRVRQAQNVGMAPAKAVLTAIGQAGKDLVGWFDLTVLGLLICLIPVLWRAVEKTRFTFPLPGLVAVGTFLILACQNTPHFYALSTAGPGRLRNIVYDSYIWLLALTLGYLLGYLSHRWTIPKRPRSAHLLVAAGLAVAVAGFVLAAPQTTTGQCVQALADGSAAAYDTQQYAWVQALSDPNAEDVVVPALTVRPPLLYNYNLTDNPESFANVAAANYYGKRSVIAIPNDYGK